MTIKVEHVFNVSYKYWHVRNVPHGYEATASVFVVFLGGNVADARK